MYININQEELDTTKQKDEMNQQIKKKEGNRVLIAKQMLMVFKYLVVVVVA